MGVTTRRFKTPDAIHLATAAHARADAFLTNDAQLMTSCHAHTKQCIATCSMGQRAALRHEIEAPVLSLR
jgi:hypothetical protein